MLHDILSGMHCHYYVYKKLISLENINMERDVILLACDDTVTATVLQEPHISDITNSRKGCLWHLKMKILARQ